MVFEMQFVLESEAPPMWEARKLKTSHNTYRGLPGSKHGKCPEDAVDWGICEVLLWQAVHQDAGTSH